MKILFIHQNFPGQYKHLAPALVEAGHDCVALTLKVTAPVLWQGVRVLPYALPDRGPQAVHPWLIDLDTKVRRGEACYRAGRQLKAAGYAPDLILAHPGWGEALFLADLWPRTRIGLYCEFYHLAQYPHVNFDPEFDQSDPELQTLRLRMKNIYADLHFPHAHAGISPTRFQADTFPPEFRAKISVIPDGIDMQVARPDAAARLTLPGQPALTRADEVITFVNRNLEPCRGYHVFLRALPHVLRARPNARVLIVGGDGVSYGAPPPQGQSWKQIFINEVRGQIPDADWARVQFLGRIPHDQFVTLLQIARVHVYLTYPFVLGWSLLEAMACEAAIVASATAPVRDVITQGQTGRLVDFFDGTALVHEICALLDNADARRALGQAARNFVHDTHDLRRICLPQQLDWVAGVMG